MAVPGPPRWGAIVLIAVSIILGVITVVVGLQEPANPLATGLMQAITLVFGTFGSYYLGTVSAAKASEEIVRPHARSAFRRMQNLYSALGRLRTAIGTQAFRLEELRDDHSGSVQFAHVAASISVLDHMVVEQMNTADDALEDWRDLVPDEVAAIEAQVHARENRKLNG